MTDSKVGQDHRAGHSGRPPGGSSQPVDRAALRRRWVILGLIFVAIVLNYIDRQILSMLKPTLKQEFGFDDRGYALLVNVFTVGYATMYPVAGWLVDRFGARVVMLLGIISLVDRVYRGGPHANARPVCVLPRRCWG